MNQISFSDEQGTEQWFSPQTKHIDSCNEERSEEQPCSTEPNSSQSNIPLNYVPLMRCSILSWTSQSTIIPNEDEVDESDNDTMDGTRVINGIHQANSDQPSFTSVGPCVTDQNHPFDMSLESLTNPSDFSESHETACSNQDRFTVKKSILAWNSLLPSSIVSNETIKNMFQNENKEKSVNLNDSVERVGSKIYEHRHLNLTSLTKHTDSRNEDCVKNSEEQHISTAPNSSHSDIPLNYVTPMRDPILPCVSQRHLVSSYDEDDKPNDNTHKEQPKNHIDTNDEIWSATQGVDLNQIYDHHLILTPQTNHTDSSNEKRAGRSRLSHMQPNTRGDIKIETETSRRECQSVQRHPTRLSMPNDETELNSIHCFMRQELLELFFYKKGQTALIHNNSKDDCSNTKNDTSTSRRNDLIVPTFNASPLTNDDLWNESLRVGFRCVHCAHLHQMPSDVSSQNINMRMNAFHPKSLAHIYRDICKWQRIHFKKCKHIPLSVKKSIIILKSVTRLEVKLVIG